MKISKKSNIYEKLSLEYLRNVQNTLLTIKDALNAKKNANEFFIPKKLLTETDKYKLIEIVDLINSDNIFINMNKVALLFDDSLSKKGHEVTTEIPYYTDTISRNDIENYLVIKTEIPLERITEKLTGIENNIIEAIDQRDVTVVAYSKEDRKLEYKDKSYRARGLKSLVLDYLLRSKANANRWWGYEDLIDVVGETDFDGFGNKIYKTIYDLNKSVKNKLLITEFILISDSKVRINPKYKIK